MSRDYQAKRLAKEQGIPYVMALRLVRERAAEIEAAAREALPRADADLTLSIRMPNVLMDAAGHATIEVALLPVPTMDGL